MYGPNQMHKGANDLAVKRSNVNVKTIILANLEDLSPMICAKIQPQGILSSGEEDF